MSPWARALHSECKAWTATANRLGMLPFPDMCDHVKRPLGLKRHPCACLPDVPRAGAGMVNLRESLFGTSAANVQRGQGGTHQRNTHHNHSPQSPERPGPLCCSRHPRRRTSGRRVTIPAPEAPFTEILIPKGNEGHEENDNKEENETMHSLNVETLRNTPANSLLRHKNSNSRWPTHS